MRTLVLKMVIGHNSKQTSSVIMPRVNLMFEMKTRMTAKSKMKKSQEESVVRLSKILSEPSIQWQI